MKTLTSLFYFYNLTIVSKGRPIEEEEKWQKDGVFNGVELALVESEYEPTLMQIAMPYHPCTLHFHKGPNVPLSGPFLREYHGFLQHCILATKGLMYTTTGFSLKQNS